MKPGQKIDKSLTAKFEALFLYEKGVHIAQIGIIQKVHRTTIYNRLATIQGYISVYPSIKAQYQEYANKIERRPS